MSNEIMNYKVYKRDRGSSNEEYCCKDEQYKWDPDEKIYLLLESEEYDYKGALVERVEHTYDEQERLTKRVVIRPDCQATTTILRVYNDDRGTCEEQELFNHEEFSKKIYQLNEEGDPVNIKTYVSGELCAEERIEYQNGNRVTHLLLNYEDGTTELTEEKYNNSDEIVSFSFKENDYQSRSEIFEYDEKGELIRSILKEGEAPQTSDEYEYNDKKQLVLTKHYSLDYPIGSTVHSYDDAGNLISAVESDEKGIVIRRLEKEYDSCNRIVQEVEVHTYAPEYNCALRYEYSNSIPLPCEVWSGVDTLSLAF